MNKLTGRLLTIEEQEALLSQTHFVLSPEAWEEFVKALEEPAPANDALKELLRRKPLWKD